jgi:coenzyme F420-reducing hydrogenase alpha subunit
MRTIKIDHIGKTEGHLGFESALENGDLREARIVTMEGARLMEGLVLNRDYSDTPIIMSRVCGVCPIVHNLGAIVALENALNVKPTPDIVLLRKIFYLDQIIHGHALHVFFLSLPDFLGISNNFNLVKKYPNESKQALELRDWAIKLCDVIGGRTTHPINSVVGGFKVEPDKKSLSDLYQKIDFFIKDAIKIFKFIKLNVEIPDFENPTNFISLTDKNEYALYQGNLKFSDSGKEIPATQFASEIQEISLPYEAVKRVERFERPFFVGALARVNLNFELLNEQAKMAWKSLKVGVPCFNSFYNTFAQSVEIIHCFEELKVLLEKYLKISNPKLFVKFKPNAGRGVGAIEAPRGTLYHYYELNKQGVVVYSNVITPTAQFLANLEKDLESFMPQILKYSEKKQKLLIKTLIRAYDPCISCATH